MSANGVTCAEFGELAPELALGILSGNERATALGHLAACAACRDQLDDLARVADNLLLLGPTREPPIGFESRVVARLQQEGGDAGQGQARQLRPRRRRTTPYRLLALAAAAAIVVVAVTVGLLEVNGAGSAKAVAMVRLNEVPADSNGSYPVFVEPVSGGAAVQVGMVPVRNGVGMRGFTVASTIGKIKAVVVRDSETPAILYRAAFAPI
jgi:anti-sigma-K factor RskA